MHIYRLTIISILLAFGQELWVLEIGLSIVQSWYAKASGYVRL